MGRILAVDYGAKRCGLAATDPLRLSVNVVGTYSPEELLAFVVAYAGSEEVDALVLTRSEHHDGTPNPIQAAIIRFAERLHAAVPTLELAYQEEHGSSGEARALLRAQGVGKKRRQQKGRIDGVAAAVILERYLRDAGVW